jgi:iron complex outermembrane receptor protein
MDYNIDYLPGTKADAYGLWNASVNFDSVDGKWGLSLIGENITDEKYISSIAFLFDPAVVPGMGTLWRLEGRVKF